MLNTIIPKRNWDYTPQNNYFKSYKLKLQLSLFFFFLPGAFKAEVNISDVVRKAYITFPLIQIRFAQYTPLQQSSVLLPPPGPGGTVANLIPPDS